MFSFLRQVIRPVAGSQATPTTVPAQLLEQANALAGHDAHSAAQLRVAALAALGVVR
ncbi:hypothetical protein [Comamonas serinivorans]|uniref:hypothetical protein n=1 Tax=Comamonas serinivorans TaxID=1082851 RepID=UPI0012F9BB72|nr:hypothetical protein [Comamonas serinivorans]